MSKPPVRLIVTTGEPAGIGPDICIALAQQACAADLVFLGDPALIHQRASQTGYAIQIDLVEDLRQSQIQQPGRLRVLPIDCPSAVTPGILNTDNAKYVTQQLDKAVELTLNGQFDALVTAPVHKGIINQAGIPFTGHTEWLAGATGDQHPVMMLANAQMRVALATTHLPLAQVSAAINRELLETVIRVLESDLRSRFNIDTPRIRVCGLNPHAGEGGHIGSEENNIITPTLDSLRAEGIQLEGPLPADTAFLPNSLRQTDAILAMYHDQGLPVLKYSDFEHAVNITLGLPIIRTSVDHGTALELAGTGKASPTSLEAAVSMAITMASGIHD